MNAVSQINLSFRRHGINANKQAAFTKGQQIFWRVGLAPVL